MIKQLLWAFFLGLGITVFMVHKDVWVHKKLTALCVKWVERSCGCKASFVIQSINFFSPSCVLVNIDVSSTKDDAWSWKCNKFTMQASWIGLLLKGVLERHVVVENFDCCSQVKSDGSLAITDFFASIMQEPVVPFPVLFKSILFKKSLIRIYSGKDVVLTLPFNSSSFATKDQIKTMFSFYEGFLTWNSVLYGEQLAADISLTTWFSGDELKYLATGSGLLQLSHMQQEGPCYMLGSYESGRGRFSLRNAYSSFVIDPIIITEREFQVSGSLPLLYAMRCIKQDLNYNDSQGSIKYSARSLRDDSKKARGYIMLQEATVDQRYICDNAKLICMGEGVRWDSTIDIKRADQELKGVATWDRYLQKGDCSIINSSSFYSSFAPYWYIAPKKFIVNAVFNQSELVAITEVTMDHRLNQSTHTLQAGVTHTGFAGAISALLDNNQLELDYFSSPFFALKNCSYKDQDGRSLVSLSQDKDTEGGVNGNISFGLIRESINSCLNYDVQGEGSLALSLKANNTTVSADIKLDNGTIRLPETYNFINGFSASASYDIAQQEAIFTDIQVSLYTGTISCLRATAFFDKNGKCTFMHAPIILDRCLLNVKKDLFAVISGNLLLLQKPSSRPQITGALIIDRAQLKENIFSHVIQKRLVDYANPVFSFSDFVLDCDVTVETKSPIAVDSSFLQTTAQLNVHVKKTGNRDPDVSGLLTLHGGKLLFPYKPLFINKGVITFFPGQLFDPAIELYACSKIKKYDVSLQVLGSLLHHHIIVDSSPTLAEEQIMTLLLVGSEENGSLNNMVPSLIIQNVKKLLFTNNQVTFFEKYFAPLLRSFSISLMPSFTDQTGRGGLKGVLEVNVNDRCRASIQKNFTLTEDTRFDLEFLLSDDITLRAIRDERRDIGGEVEMKWKF